jgi:hypothetical protein
MINSRFAAIAISSALALSFSACNQNLTPTGTSQLVSGSITALSPSSLTVAGKSFNLNSAAKSRSKAETNVSVNGEAAKHGALSVGQHVTVKADGADATDIDVDLELKGAIKSVTVTPPVAPATVATEGTVLVDTTTVIVSSATRIDLGEDNDEASSTTHTIADLALLPVGTFVEVTGTTDATTGNVTASKIEVKTDKEIGEDGDHKNNEFKGIVSGLVAGATSFMLDTITVNCVLPCSLPEALKNGDKVEVKGTLDATGLILTASKVHLEGRQHLPPVPGSSIVIESKIRTIDTTAKTFTFERFTVDYSGVTPAPTINAKDRVKVEGTVDATDIKIVHASAITVLKPNEPNDDGSHGDHGGHHGGGEGGTPPAPPVPGTPGK